MKRTIIAAAVLALGAAGAGVSLADPGDGPGPNGHNDYGLCTAYSAGSEQGQAQKHKAPPFKALEDAAGGADKVGDYCADKTPGGK